jgi:heterodisulfide reductase subunit C
MDHSPRQLFAMIRAGMRDEVLQSNTPWICVSCYYCTVRCPQEIQITDVMYALKSMAIHAHKFKEATASDFSKTFIGMVENFGRSFELGLASVHYLKHFPLRLPGMAPMIVGLLSKKRIVLTPHRIEGIDQLKIILARAKELEGLS